ncbi:hypothetical protein I79_009757 [Cricetulus griseus]|uniref:Uncharacterized protein n=1 Tax=Cricetulus griseus TaxID=10029 RepID=G3HGL9_CRIGR|nr:hypothetical protein I79_009757 [Cricetulus griseus]
MGNLGILKSEPTCISLFPDTSSCLKEPEIPELCTLQLDVFPTNRLWNPFICLFATIQ